VDELFQRLRSQGRKAFIPFITAGDPSLDATAALIRRLADAGASLIEIGFPYSDPIADGPVIQASYARALEHGIRADEVFECIREVRDQGSGIREQGVGSGDQESATTHDSALSTQYSVLGTDVPLVAMVSYSIVHRRGPAQFVEQAASAGFGGMIVP